MEILSGDNSLWIICFLHKLELDLCIISIVFKFPDDYLWPLVQQQLVWFGLMQLSSDHISTSWLVLKRELAQIW